MWHKQEESRASSNASEPVSTPRVEPVRSVAGITAEVVQPSGGLVTSSLLIKGEIHGGEDLYIDGEVQGTIRLSSGRLTVGPHGRIMADVDASEIVVRGKVEGALHARERVEVCRTGELRGDIVTQRIAIEEGAQIHSKVEITRPEDSRRADKPENSSGSASLQAIPLETKV